MHTGSRKIPTKNSFDALNNQPNMEEVENPHKTSKPGKGKKTLDLVLEKIPSHDPQDHSTPGKDPDDDEGEIIMQIDEMELEEIDLDKLEETLNQKELQSIQVEKLRKVHKVFINSTMGTTSLLGIHLHPNPNPKWNQK
jgi:hypothetical protein